MATTKRKTGTRVPDDQRTKIIEAARALSMKQAVDKFSENAPTDLLDGYVEAFVAGVSFALARLADGAAR
jgi:hypothetical protein